MLKGTPSSPKSTLTSSETRVWHVFWLHKIISRTFIKTTTDFNPTVVFVRSLCQQYWIKTCQDFWVSKHLNLVLLPHAIFPAVPSWFSPTEITSMPKIIQNLYSSQKVFFPIEAAMIHSKVLTAWSTDFVSWWWNYSVLWYVFICSNILAHPCITGTNF